MSRRRFILIYVAVSMVCASGLAVFVLLPDAVAKLTYAAEAGRALAATEQLRHAVDLSRGFQQVASVVRPSVVSISSVKRFQSTSPPREDPFSNVPDELSPFFNDDFFNRFFQPPALPRGNFEQHGLGSGVVITSDGFILTNNHVVQGADEVTVELSDDRQFDAEVVGTDPKTDVAVLKIDANGLVPAQLGDSDQVEVGQWALAVGSPFGLSETVTVGIVSAKGRADVGIADYEDFIQTDAAINPGNSGGPLVNLKGEVIGINTAIASRSGGYMGVGFAIPSNMARDVMESIRKHGHVQRGYLGAMIQDLSEDLARSFGFTSNDGVLVGDVLSGSPAGKAGLKPGDIVLSYNSKPVHSASQLRNAIAATEPDSEGTLEVYRERRTLKLAVTIGKFTEPAAAMLSTESAAVEDLGLAVETLTPDLASRLGFDGSDKGVVVTDVQPNSHAARLGIRPNSLITAVGTKRVANVKEFRDAMADTDFSKGIRIQIKSEGVSRFLYLKVR